ncbi:PASTA domain-containing protein [candidate division WOR-3 bacterium]|nr:PASTA domain-containing protein [candidate division WOR-3 bacterium]
MKRSFIYLGAFAGSFIMGFIIFYFLMPIIVHRGKTIDVPYLKHMSVQEAKDFLGSLGLKGEVYDSVHSLEVERGRVIETIPPKKKEVKIGTKIELVVSKGPEKLWVPDIIGLLQKIAEDSLDKYGITNRVIINIPVEKKNEDGLVIKTKPIIVDSLEKGGKITLFIGKEKRKVFLMPNLIGLPLDEAKEILVDYELKLAPIKRTESPKEGVLLQSPLAGIEVTFGDTVKLIVGGK